MKGKTGKIQRRQKPNGHATRFATPFTVKCLSCSAYTYKNKRHNAFKETALGKDYLGVESYYFHIKCTGCKTYMTIRTDPKNGVYVAEDRCVKVEEVEKGDNEYAVDNQLKKESNMKDEIGRLKLQMSFVSSKALSIDSANNLENEIREK